MCAAVDGLEGGEDFLLVEKGLYDRADVPDVALGGLECRLYVLIRPSCIKPYHLRPADHIPLRHCRLLINTLQILLLIGVVDVIRTLLITIFYK